jgi:acetoin utilization protein AcuB
MSKLNVSVEEYTTPNPVTATEESSVEQLGQLMKEHGIRHIPIVRGDEVVGVVSDRDLKVIAGLNLGGKASVRAGDIMTREPVTFSSEASLDEVAFEMSKRKIGSVIVNEGNQLLGIFTVTDALNALIEIARASK